VTDEPSGARAQAIPLPELRRIKRAIESLGTGIDVGRPKLAPAHPMGERGDAAQCLGILKALVQQIEYGLIGGPLQTDVQKGVFAAYGRDLPAILAAESAHVGTLVKFAAEGIMQVPHASQQMSAAALGLTVAEHGFAAAAEIAVGVDAPGFSDTEVTRQSEAMYEAADKLTDYVAGKRAEWEAEA
jgi:hypothetical protein